MAESPVHDEELRALLALTLTRRVGPKLCRLFYEEAGGFQDVWRMSRGELESLGLNRQPTENILAGFPGQAVDDELEEARRLGVQILPFYSENYPRLLSELPDAPPVLYVRGTLSELDLMSVAVVGARRCTTYGKKQAKLLAAGVARANFTVISGMAYGIDAAAHRGALNARGRTLAVLGSGLARIYPEDHLELAVEIAENGALISEFSLDTPPEPRNFPQRNRLMSGMSLGVLVVEASERSGSLITASWASDQGREVCAVPGPVDSPYSRGCHRLLKDGATLVETAEDIVNALGPLPAPISVGPRPRPARRRRSGDTAREPAKPAPRTVKDAREVLLNSREREVFQQLSSTEPRTIDDICEMTALPVSQVSGTLLSLELKNIVNQLPGKRYLIK